MTASIFIASEARQSISPIYFHVHFMPHSQPIRSTLRLQITVIQNIADSAPPSGSRKKKAQPLAKNIR
jgi:hypothetical protein